MTNSWRVLNYPIQIPKLESNKVSVVVVVVMWRVRGYLLFSRVSFAYARSRIFSGCADSDSVSRFTFAYPKITSRVLIVAGHDNQCLVVSSSSLHAGNVVLFFSSILCLQ